MNNRKKELRDLETTILQKNKNKQENEVILEEGDLDGKLSWNGYSRLKDECKYIDYQHEIEIKMPQVYVADFKCTLESMASNELLHIRKDTRETRLSALILFVLGCIILAIGVSINHVIRQELFIIFSWVFIWAATEKFFFDRSNLQDNRYNLLHILSARVTSYG